MSKTIYSDVVNPNNNFLFTVDQLNQAKTNDKCLPVRCLQCGKTFYISRKNYLVFAHEHSQNHIQHSFKFCSKECRAKYVHNNSTQVTKPCLFCGKMVIKPLNQAKKHPNFFCCRSHAASYNNARRDPPSLKHRLKISQSICKYRVEHRDEIKNTKHSKFKRGWHITWNGKNVYYRSSYELDFCIQLDADKIDYDMEAIAIEYYDSQRRRLRNALPDFLLIESNTIVEIKSTYTYDRQNMIDKSNQYKKLGYKFKLILDHKEYDYCP